MPLIGQAKLDYMRRRYLGNPEPIKAYVLAYDKERRKRDPEAYRNIQYKRRYGITVAAQGGKCALCTEKFKPTKQKLAAHVDHCHTTMKVRAILCSRCNLGLGLFKDDPNLLRDALKYLKAHQPGSISGG